MGSGCGRKVSSGRSSSTVRSRSSTWKAAALSLFPRSDLGLDAGIAPTPRSPTEFSIGHNVASEAEVDQVMARAEKAGARITMPPRKTFWGGYAGYFQDPDGHLWEVLHNPAFLPDEG